MDGTVIKLLLDYPWIGMLIALAVFGALFLLKKKLAVLMQPPRDENRPPD